MYLLKKWRLSDITDIRNSTFQLSVLSVTPNTNLEGSIYAHESVVSADGNILFAFDEFNDFDIAAYDISDLTSPQLIRQFQWSKDDRDNSIVHNGFVRGDYLIVAYYEAGLRVFDVSDVYTDVTEVGHLETYRDPDGDGIFDNSVTAGFFGAWNVYVGLPSGKILISDLNYGTFVVTINDNAPTPAPLSSPMPTSSLTLSPTLSPTSSPPVSLTTAPALRPSPVPSNSPTSAITSPPPTINSGRCSPDKIPFVIKLKTDFYGVDTSWRLEINTRGKYWDLVARNGMTYDGNTLYHEEICIPKNECFKFFISDAAQDGFCCTHSYGHYSIHLDNQMLKYSVYNNSAENESTPFGTGGKMCLETSAEIPMILA